MLLASVIREATTPRQSPWRLPVLAIFAATLLSLPAVAGGRATLSIGITQFPATLNPNIDVMAAKNYVLGMAHAAVHGL